MDKEHVKALSANTYEELTVKMIGFYHDHCWHHYQGLVKNLPEKYKYLIEGDQLYIFVYEEAIPNKPN